VIELARKAGEDAAAASAVTAANSLATSKADLETKQIANLKSVLPQSTPPTEKTAVDIDGFKHVAEFRQVQLMEVIGASIATKVGSALGGNPLIILQSIELDGLRSATLPYPILRAELDDMTTQTALIEAQKCKAIKPKGDGRISRYSLGGALLIADSLFGLALKVSQAFQTTLGDVAASNLTGGEKVVQTAIVHGLLRSDPKPASIRVGLPPISEQNPVVQSLKKLRASSDTLVQSMAGKDAKSDCIVVGTARLEATQARLKELNTAPSAGTPSATLTAMRLAEIESRLGKNTIPSSYILTTSVAHTGGSIASTKTSFTSQKYMRLSTVAVTYDLQDINGDVLLAGVITEPSDDSRVADVVKVTKTFEKEN